MNEILHNTYSISMDDLMGLWVESLHPFGTILVIWDAGRHFDSLKQCGINLNITEGYNNKALTIEVLEIPDAYSLIDIIEQQGYSPYMQVYHDGKLLSDNL